MGRPKERQQVGGGDMSMVLGPLLRAVVFASIGFTLGGGIAAFLSGLAGRTGATEPVMALGYLFALIGWLLGVGVWDVWAREWFGLPIKHEEIHDWRRYFRFTTDHKVIGVQYLVTF